MSDSLPRRWWLAPPGVLRRLQMTLTLLIGLAVIGVVVGAIAARTSTVSPWAVGVGAALVAELVGFAVPVHLRASRRFELPATPDQVFDVAKDPTALLRFSPMPLKVRLTGGDPGAVGSTYEASSSGLTMRTRVIDSQPGRRLVTETRSRLSRVTATRSYEPSDSGTLVHIETLQRMPLAAWLLAPVFRAEVEFTLRETERRLRSHFAYGQSVAPSD